MPLCHDGTVDDTSARNIKFLGKREGNGGTPVREPPPGGKDDDVVWLCQTGFSSDTVFPAFAVIGQDTLRR